MVCFLYSFKYNAFSNYVSKLFIFFITFQILINDISKKYFFLNKTALHIAVEKGDPEIVQNILMHESVDVNAKSILKINFF